MVHRLAAPAPDVGHKPITGLGDAGLAAEVRGDRKQSAEERPVRLDQVRGRRDVPARDQQDVGRCLWGDVADGDDRLVVVQSLRR